VRSFSISGRERVKLHRSSKSRLRTYPAELLNIEDRLIQRGVRLIAGVDEAGRGPLAGPVVACAVILRPERVPPGIRDSKQLSPDERTYLCEAIRRDAIAVGTGVIQARGIDRINILQATMLAMTRAVRDLDVEPECVMVDGNRLPDLGIPVIGLVGGDRRCLSIGAASIVAKVTRDRFMERMDAIYPRYRFRLNKGYGTRDHLDALKKYGPTRVHRYSFEPVAGIVEGRL
jgi:ribonuclease HII